MNEEFQKQLEEEATLVECSIDGKTRIWVSKTEKVDYDELYRIIIEMNKTRLQKMRKND